MKPQDLNNRISQLVVKCVELKNKYVEEKDLQADYVCMFSHSKNEYEELIK